MKIAFNPSTVAALTTPPNNKDITFDLRGRNIFARGVKFCGTDTWRDIKINNVSIGSNILDLRNGSNTTLTNTNGVVTINSTWRPVVDNLTSDSTTSSLSANQGRVLAGLINGKSDSGHTHDNRYVKKSGDTMSGVLTIDTTNFGALTIKRNDDANGASIQFRGKSSIYGYIGLNNSTKDKQFLRWSSDTSRTYTILDTSSTYTSNGKGVINGTTITQVDNATNSTNSTNARKLVNWYSARPTSLNTQFGDGSLRIFYATSSTTEGKCPDDATVLHLAWDNNGGWDTQLGINSPSGRVYSRAQSSGTWQPWKTLAFTTDIPSSLKNPHALTISLNGTSQGPYDGSAAKNINITPGSIGAATSDHNHDGRYVRYYAVTTLDCNNLAVGLTAAGVSATNAAHTNHSAFLYISDVGTPFQIQIPDSSVPYIYKRYYGSGGWSGWFKLSAGYADSAGSVAWDNIIGKPSTFNPAAHTHTVFRNNLMIKGTNGISDSASIHLGIGDSDTGMNWFKNPTVNGNKVWNAGNDGSGSGLDADTLDGYHENSFLRYRGTTSTDQEATLWNQIGIKTYHNALPDGLTGVYNYGSVISLPGNGSRFEIYASDQSSSGNGLYYRSGWNSDKKSWLKFIDSSNIGSQSVNYANSAGNADTVDGYHEGSFVHWLGNKKFSEFATTYNGGIYNMDGNPSGVSGLVSNSWNQTVFNVSNYSNVRQKQLVFRYDSDEIYYRRHTDSGWTSTRVIAFLDSKVSDADKLDGIHANGLLTSVTNTNNGISVTVGGTTKSVSNISVNYANSAGSADTLDGVHLSGIFTAFGNNNHNITATIGGVTKEFQVNYASDADTVDGEHASSFVRAGHYESADLNKLDTYSFIRSVNSNNNSTSPKGNTGWYNIIQAVHRNGDDDGPNYMGQIALGMTTNRDDMFFRTKYENTWNSWKTVIHSGNYTEFISNYYWANVKISTSSSTTTSPTVHTLTATRVCAGHNPEIDNSISCSNWFRSSGATGWYNTTYQGGWYMSDTYWVRAHNGVGIYTSGQIYSPSSIRMSDILLEHTNEINSASGVHLNYRSSGNVSLCSGGGNVGIGTTLPAYKLDVNGQVRASGFHHVNHDNNDAVLLAGGGYSQGVPVKYWSIESISIYGPTQIFRVNRGGNYTFVTKVEPRIKGSCVLTLQFPSGYYYENTIIWARGVLNLDISDSSNSTIYATIFQFSESKYYLNLSDDDSLNNGSCQLYFMCF